MPFTFGLNPSRADWVWEMTGSDNNVRRRNSIERKELLLLMRCFPSPKKICDLTPVPGLPLSKEPLVAQKERDSD
jgi:hypothetical protein